MTLHYKVNFITFPHFPKTKQNKTKQNKQDYNPVVKSNIFWKDALIKALEGQQFDFKGNNHTQTHTHIHTYIHIHTHIKKVGDSFADLYTHEKGKLNTVRGCDPSTKNCDEQKGIQLLFFIFLSNVNIVCM